MPISLKRGDNNDQVLLLQRLLNHHGASIKNPVTNFGPQTENAVREFQERLKEKDEAVVVDGIVGQQTWNALVLTQRGDKGPVVEMLQELLNKRGYDVGLADGAFGARTEARVKEVQLKANLVVDGVAGIRVWSYLLTEVDDPKELRESDLISAASELGVDVTWLKAIVDVESGPFGGFFSNGYPTLLFERHWMRRRCISQHLTTLVAIVEQVRPDLINNTWGGYAGGSKEVLRFNEAKGLNRQAALESASYGLFQIMGFHWENLGYESAEDFYAQMCESEGKQLDALVRFIKADKRLLKATVERDYERFAEIYNGPAYKKNDYHNKLRKAHERYLTL